MRRVGFKGSRVQGVKGDDRAPCEPRTSPISPPLGPWAPRPLGPSGPHAFTIIELIVVITVIVLILAIAVPGLSRMNDEMRMTSAKQSIQGVTTQAYLLSLADRAMTAVRFFPGAWDSDPNAATVDTRQHMAVYSYVGTSVQENPPGSGTFQVQLGEYFERAKDLGSVKLPEGVWSAPLEALSPSEAWLGPTQQYYGALGSEFVLDGKIGQFEFNADHASSTETKNLLNADDFLLVCDPETGMRTGTPTLYHLRAFVPTWRYDADTLNTSNLSDMTGWYQRYSFSGVVTYPREPLLNLPGGTTAAGSLRQDVLRLSGRPYLVHRFSGGLLAGAVPPG